MNEFTPPKPAPHASKLSPLRRLFKVRRSSISVLYARSYSMHLGHIWTPLKNLYWVNQPSLVERILVTDAERFPKSNLMGTMLELLLGNGVFVSNGSLWRQQRRMLDPAFEQARIKEVFPLMRDAVEAVGRRLAARAHGSAVAVDAETTHVTADIIFRTIFSRPLSPAEASEISYAFNRFQELAYAHGVWVMAGMPDRVSIGRWRAKRHAEVIRNYLQRAVAERIAERDSGAPAQKDILASLLDAIDPETGARFSEAELVDQIAVLFLAGHETSASALAWSLYLIANRPDIQDRMHREAAEVFGGGQPEFSHMKRLKLARDVFRETLRLYPPVSFVTRDAALDETMRNKLIRAGSILFVSPWLIQRHRSYWERPDVFDPDRYAREETKESLRCAYIPFSAGPRVCLGASFAMQEATLILAYLARHFRFEPVEGHTPVPVARLTLRSENGIWLRVLPRSAAVRHDAA